MLLSDIILQIGGLVVLSLLVVVGFCCNCGLGCSMIDAVIGIYLVTASDNFRVTGVSAVLVS